ncbi:MAG: hypothetical protein RR740_00435 [Pseudomonas sp.]
MSVKHPQSIIAVNSAVLDKIGLHQGLNMLHLDALIPLIQGDIVIGQREALEVDESKRQLLPYAVLTRPHETTGNTTFFAYRRGKGVGEARLSGNVSIGLGGHIDLADVVHENSIINVGQTVIQGVARELQEEVVFGGVDSDLGIQSVGCLIDNANSVGKVHLGLVLTAALQPGVTVECAEEELETLGFFTPQELLDSGLPLENWTKIICEFFVENEL